MCRGRRVRDLFRIRQVGNLLHGGALGVHFEKGAADAAEDAIERAPVEPARGAVELNGEHVGVDVGN